MDFLEQDDDLLIHEKLLWDKEIFFVAGIDEAGRGCCAGPVVAAAVIFTDRTRIPKGVFDSKQLTAKQRFEMREKLLSEPSVIHAAAEVSPEEIDKINILRATWKAMANAVAATNKAEFALVDGNPVKGLPVPSQNLVKGDALSASIAAASIIAKTTRDMIMEEAAKKYPEYGFEIHKGYCTSLHTERLKKYGPCPIHRLTFEPVKSIVNPPDVIQGELF